MQLATILNRGRTAAALVDPLRGGVLVEDLFDEEFFDAAEVIRRLDVADLRRRLEDAPSDRFIAAENLRFTAPYRKPRLIWGIGLNYQEHAADLTEVAPATAPASFIKGDHTVIGPGEPIPLPWQSHRVTAEAEMGIIIGRDCRNVSEADALDYVWGVVPVLDQTAEDILAENPRYLTRSKNFPGFFSFGPTITPMAEVRQRHPDIAAVHVSTVNNGSVHRSNTVANMTFGPAELISFHSQVMPLQAGDIISTGTPGAVHIRAGDTAECRLDSFGILTNPVVEQAPREVRV